MFKRAGLAAAGMFGAAAVAFWRTPVTTSEFDSLRPPEPAGGKRRRNGKGKGRRAVADGSREMPMVPEAEFTSYYGRPVVKPAPWGHEVAAYLFLGGVAGGSGLLAAGAQLTGRNTLRRNCPTVRPGRCDAGRGRAGEGPG